MTPRRPTGSRRGAGARQQRGVVMWVALGVLIIMTLAGLAMLRQMGGGLSIAGNLAFKQSATAVADLGTEAGRAWITTPGRNLTNTQAGAGYFSSWGNSVDPASVAFVDWTAIAGVTEAATGNTVKYVIHRLCELPEVDANGPLQHCSAEGGSSTNHGVEPGGGFASIAQPYFRITTQVTGPRNTVSYIQVVTN